MRDRIGIGLTLIIPFLKKKKKSFLILFIHERHRETGTQAEGEAGSMQEARCGIRSQDPRTTPPKADAQQLSHPGIPIPFVSKRKAQLT